MGVGQSRASRSALGLISMGLLLTGCWADVGRPPGSSSARTIDINKAGAVAVSADSELGSIFLRSPDGTWTLIAGGFQDDVYAIDGSGNAVGYATSLTDGGPACAAIWPAGEPGRCLSPPSAGREHDRATDVNDHGVVVGQQGDLPVMWTETGELRTLPLARPTDTWGRVEAINTHGAMVGMVGALETQNSGRAVRWDSPTSPPVELEVEPSAHGSVARAISDSGVMVGSITDSNDWHRTVVWRPDGSVRELPVADAAVLAVSDLDAPVGFVLVDNLHRAAVFDPDTLLPTLVGPSGRDSTANVADGDRIAGWIRDPNTGGLDIVLYEHPSFDP